MKGIKLLAIVALGAAVFFSSSCKKPKVNNTTTPAFTLQFKAKYGSQSFALNSPNIDSAGRYVAMTTLQFYLSHINLIKTDGSKVLLADAAIINFSDSVTLSISVNTLQGDFTGLSFGCGLDSNQNKATPNDSLFPNPFSGDWGMYWDMNTAYRFEVMEGKWASTPTSTMPNYLAYHIGNNIAYRQTQVNKNFSVCCNAPYTLTLYLDVQQIFSNNITGETINIVTQPETSSGVGDDPAIAAAFADNFSKAF